jgi:hypothetical protein
VPGDTGAGQEPRPPHESQSPNVGTGLRYRERMRLDERRLTP